MNRPTFPCDLRAALAAPSLDRPLHPALSDRPAAGHGAISSADGAASPSRTFGRFEVEILDKPEFDRLNEELAEICERYGPESPRYEREAYIALREPVLAALRRTFRQH